MKSWNELSMAEKADVMKLAIDGGVYDLDSIRSGYNEYAKGGKIHIDPSKKGTFTAAASKHRMGVQQFASKVLAHPENYSSAMRKKANFARNASKWKHGDGGWLESLATTASKKVMDYIQAFPTNPFTYDWQNADGDGTAQDTYLLPRKLQEKEFLRKGYIKGKNKDYGLVKKAVGDRDLPVYQTSPDATTRDKLILLGNDGYYVAEHGLEHPGSHPLATYTDGHGNFYQKAWDLNDYGGEGGSTESIAGKLLDMVGSPVVVTTGYQKIKDHPWQVGALKGMMAKKGLVPTEIDGKTEWTLPEVTVVGKRRKHGLGGNLFGNGGEEETTAYTPIAEPVIPKVKGDQEAVNWIANWYNNRREQLYNNLQKSDKSKIAWYNLKESILDIPSGRLAVNHDYYHKLNNMANFQSATFDDLKKDAPHDYEVITKEWGDDTYGYTLPTTQKIYYNNSLIQKEAKGTTRKEGYSPLGTHIHERIHTIEDIGKDGHFMHNSPQLKALEDINIFNPWLPRDEYIDSIPEIYARMMQFRYNHNMDPKKKYTKEEIKKMLEEENVNKKNSDLHHYDLDALTRAFNEVAYNNRVNNNPDNSYFT